MEKTYTAMVVQAVVGATALRMLVQTRKGRYPVAEQWFGMYNIRIHHIVFELCLSEKKRKKERNNTNKLKFSCLVFSTLRNVSGTY